MTDQIPHEDRIEGMANALDDDQKIMVDLSKPKTPAEYARLFFSGFAMGASDIVPGVSGGTMAFILGVYETLIDAIKSFNFEAIRLALGFKIGELIDHVNLRFLIALGLGLLTAVLMLASLLHDLLETQPTFVFVFFAGLIVASAIAVGAKIQWSGSVWPAFIIGTVGAFIVVGLPTMGDQLGHGPLILFLSGMIAICAMILPGISGSFILLILGQYDFILGAVRNFDIVSVVATGLGAVVGILAFSRILSWLLKNYENATIAVLVGFMVGSLRLIWHEAFVVGVEVMPEFGVAQIILSIVLFIVGFVLVSAVDHLQSGDNPFLRLFSGSRQPTMASGD